MFFHQTTLWILTTTHSLECYKEFLFSKKVFSGFIYKSKEIKTGVCGKNGLQYMWVPKGISAVFQVDQVVFNSVYSQLT